jgi:phosphomannomutase/phosphoglucomutase
VNTIDGLRVEYPDGFGLMRASNTTPVIVLRFEADSDAALARIQTEFKKVLLGAKPDARIPF